MTIWAKPGVYRYRGARLTVHWLIDQFLLIDQISTERIGVSCNKVVWLIDQFWVIDQFLAAKTADPLSVWVVDLY